MSPALAGGFLTTAPPEKPLSTNFGRHSDSGYALCLRPVLLFPRGNEPQFGAILSLTLFWLLFISLRPRALQAMYQRKE